MRRLETWTCVLCGMVIVWTPKTARSTRDKINEHRYWCGRKEPA